MARQFFSSFLDLTPLFIDSSLTRRIGYRSQSYTCAAFTPLFASFLRCRRCFSTGNCVIITDCPAFQSFKIAVIGSAGFKPGTRLSVRVPRLRFTKLTIGGEESAIRQRGSVALRRA